MLHPPPLSPHKTTARLSGGGEGLVRVSVGRAFPSDDPRDVGELDISTTPELSQAET
jgi:hypothetical protein